MMLKRERPDTDWLLFCQLKNLNFLTELSSSLLFSNLACEMERFLRIIKPPADQPSTSSSPSSSRLEENDSSAPTVSTKTSAKGRSFQASWKSKFPWLLYDAAKQKAFCKVCTEAKTMGAPLPSSAHDQESFRAFVRDGFSGWAKALERFGLAIRGKTDEDSNPFQLLKLRARDIPELRSWLGRTEHKWLSHDILNEMTEIMAHDVLSTLLGEIKSNFYSVIMDETADISVREQVSICFRIVSDDLEPEEYFVGFYATSSTTADALFQLLKDALARFALPLNKCRGQCYDGASNMAGVKSGLQACVLEQEPRAQYVHCTAHLMNLIVHDVAQSIPACRNFMSLIRELITFIRNSPKRLAWFKEFQGTEAPQLRPLCPTRWTVRAASLQSIATNYSALMDFLEDMSANEKGDAGGKASGLFVNLQKFGTFFSLRSMLTFFSRVEAVNVALQKRQLHTQSAREMIDTLRGDLKAIREAFGEFWENTTAAADDMGLESPVLPRPRKIPRRLENAVGPARNFQTPDELYRHQYVQVIDTASAALDCRFSPAAFKHMQDVEEFVTGKSDCNAIMQFYQDDLDASRLTLHRDMCVDIAKQRGVCLATFQDVVDFLKGDSDCHVIYSNVTSFSVDTYLKKCSYCLENNKEANNFCENSCSVDSYVTRSWIRHGDVVMDLF
ncbi:unnamed protein product [Scomber scombrus]|uniref:Unnamed protein product n=1 Tax=Scomber scombrus TaxID=13677 RepID=A0AAV1P6B1_SCOSC